MKQLPTLKRYVQTCNKLWFPGENIELVENDIVHVPTNYADKFIKEVGFPVPIHLISVIPDTCLNFVIDEIPNNSNLLSWTTTGSYFDHEKIKNILVIGIDRYNSDIIEYSRNLVNKEKLDKVFFGHNPTGNILDRINLPLTKIGHIRPNDRSNEINYLDTISKYKYIYAGSGGGLLTGKIFEACIVGSIPIVKEHSTRLKILDDLNINYICLPGTICITADDHFNPLNNEMIESDFKYKVSSNTQNSIDLIPLLDEDTFHTTEETCNNYFDKVYKLPHIYKPIIKYNFINHLLKFQEGYPYFLNGLFIFMRNTLQIILNHFTPF